MSTLARLLAFGAALAVVFAAAAVAGDAIDVDRGRAADGGHGGAAAADAGGHGDASEGDAAADGGAHGGPAGGAEHGGATNGDAHGGPSSGAEHGGATDGETAAGDGHDGGAALGGDHGGVTGGHGGAAGDHGAVTPDGDPDAYALHVERSPGALDLRVADREGATLRDFDVSHEKELHVIVVRRDLSGFQHLHPRQRADGTWRTPLQLGRPGAYRVFADFETGGRKYTPTADLQVDGAVRSAPLPAPASRDRADGLDVALHQHGQEFEFTVTRDGRPVALEDYLGAKGHLVALRATDLEYAHVHADADALAFAAELPSTGRYRLYLQFQVDGRVHTAEFTVDA